jgi:EmrB/QacA subfamily drug resistance transporter
MIFMVLLLCQVIGICLVFLKRHFILPAVRGTIAVYTPERNHPNPERESHPMLPSDTRATHSTTAAACAPRSVPWLLAATILASSMVFVDGTVMNLALPALQISLNTSFIDLQWVVQSYALLVTALLLVGGAVGDRYGRKRAFLAGVTLFAVASLWCGCARGVHELIAARAMQGIGGALLVPGSLAIISTSFDQDKRGRMIGIWSGATAITTALGPVLGGWLIERFSWRAVFFINIPLAAAVLAISFLHVPESRNDKAEGSLDWRGAALATLGLCGVVIGLTEAPARGWDDVYVIVAIVLGVSAVAAFFAVERSHPAPMIPLGLFRSRVFLGTNLMTVLLYAALSGCLFFLPLDLVQVRGYSTTAAGAALLPIILLMFTLSPLSGRLSGRYGARLLLTIGPATAALGLALFAVHSMNASYWLDVFPGIMVLGLGMSLAVAPLTTAVMNSVPTTHSGVASAINNTASRLGALFAVALLGIVMTAVFNWSLDGQAERARISPESFTIISSQRTKLAAISLPASVPASEAKAARGVINDGFVAGYRCVMALSALLALASAASAAGFMGRAEAVED